MSSFLKYLNPLFKSLDDVADFSSYDLTNPLYKEEIPYFVYLENHSIDKIRVLRKRMIGLEKELEEQIEIIESETGDAKKDAVGVYNKLFGLIMLLVDRINRELDIVDNPYFGKIKVLRHKLDRYPQTEVTSYIGKFSVFDEETKRVLITDWRAPIANLYYINSGPTKNVRFNSPVGQMSGDLLQKRQFDISIAKIRNIYDAKSGNVSADEFLLAQLNRRLGKKLADIVATIQSQQNEIIRDEINKPVILQGVAGSGKTTIVLHRLAYLFYTYTKETAPQKSLIVAPNRMFLDYISDVLPSLGIRGVESNTYLFWAKKILGWTDKNNLSNEAVNLDVKKYKGSEQFLKNLETFFDEYEQKIVDGLPYSESDIVAKKYWDIKKDFSKIYLKERFDLALNSTYLSQKVASMTREVGKEASDATKEKIQAYIKSATDVFTIYKAFIEDRKYNTKEVEDYTKKTLTRFTFTNEDLSPLLWIYFKLNGIEEHKRDYIVVDEAQDMSPFELYTLFTIAKKGNLFLAGDIAQSIIPPFQIQSWDIVKNIIENRSENKFTYHQLNRCYRTTVEIIEYANEILKNYFPKSYELPEAVLRHGDKVEVLEDSKDLVNIINNQFKKGSATVALVCKDENQANSLFEALKSKEKKLDNPVYTYSDSDYKTGILVLPVNKAKGLEFDSVILINQEDYNMNNEYDSRLFYVAVTRALHRLYILKRL